MLERELMDIAAGSYRSRRLERAVMQRELRGEAERCTQRRRVRSK